MADEAVALHGAARHVELGLWRAVEAQHIAATRGLVDTLAEQALLEDILDAAKPPLPAAAERLHYLLATPFRYPPLPTGSRFRGRDDPGVWYGAEALRTACAEVGYWRCRFVADSAGLDRLESVPHTLFHARAGGKAIDLREAVYARDARWRDPDDYRRCQQLARAARTAGVQVIRYASVRDPQSGSCAAVLDAACFGGHGGVDRQQTWFLSVDARRASWIRSGARGPRAESFEFDYAR